MKSRELFALEWLHGIDVAVEELDNDQLFLDIRDTKAVMRQGYDERRPLWKVFEFLE